MKRMWTWMCLLALMWESMRTEAWAPTPAEREVILEAHTRTRESVRPPASNMLMMKYSEEMERLAEDWLSRCIYDHPNPNVYRQFKGIGQNLAIVGGYDPDYNTMMKGWIDEGPHYHYSSRSCSAKTCLHYTQMVWATTTEVGCAIRRCDNAIPNFPKPAYILACQYKSVGNWRGEHPYKYGSICSECPPNHTCRRNQCVSNEAGQSNVVNRDTSRNSKFPDIHGQARFAPRTQAEASQQLAIQQRMSGELPQQIRINVERHNPSRNGDNCGECPSNYRCENSRCVRIETNFRSQQAVSYRENVHNQQQIRLARTGDAQQRPTYSRSDPAAEPRSQAASRTLKLSIPYYNVVKHSSDDGVDIILKLSLS